MARPLRCLSALLLALSGVVHSQAQAPSSSDPIVSLMADAQKSYASQSWDDAILKFQAIIDLARERHDDLWEARGVSGLGAVAYVRSRYDEARRYLSQSLDTFDRLQSHGDTARVEKMLGDLAFAVGDMPGARAWYEKAEAAAGRAGNAAGRIQASRMIVRLDDDEGNAQALDRIAKLAEDAKTLGDHDLDAAVRHQWADILFAHGEYEAAIEKLNEAAQLYESAGRLDDLSTVYNSLGRLFRAHGQPNAALQAQLKALAIQENLDAPFGHVQSLNAVAVSYAALGDAAKAREYYQRAIALAQRVGLKVWLPTIRGNLGHLLIETGEVARGRAMIEEVLPVDLPSRQSMRNAELAEADLKLGNHERARVAAERALATCESGDRVDCIWARLTRAGVELASGNDAGALIDQRAALDLIERLHSTLAASDFLKQGFAASWIRSYSIAIDLETRQGDWRAALETAELARARAFVDLIASRDNAARPLAAATDLTWRGAPAAGPIAVRSDSSASPETVSDLVAAAGQLHTTLLQYWLGDNDLYAWVISSDGTISGARTAVTRARVERLVRAVGAPRSPTESAEAWKTLYDLLIGPVDRHLPARAGAHVTIVPHGPLMQLPFAALRDPRGRYLVERFTLASVPSVAMLRYTGARRTDARTGAMLLVADPSAMPTIAGESRLPRLPGALAEARAIARLVPASRATLLAEGNATEPRVLTAAPRKSVIHFATHAIVRDVDPWSSFLALGVPGDGGADGKLTAQKVYGLSLDADLIVLSACRSGGGLITGDGIASLARAFFYAGASSMIVSVWDVADESAKRLLPAFYRSWLAGADKATALRNAQLALLRDLRAGRVIVSTPAGAVALVENPALWAGFVLLGDPN